MAVNSSSTRCIADSGLCLALSFIMYCWTIDSNSDSWNNKRIYSLSCIASNNTDELIVMFSGILSKDKDLTHRFFYPFWVYRTSIFHQLVVNTNNWAKYRITGSHKILHILVIDICNGFYVTCVNLLQFSHSVRLPLHTTKAKKRGHCIHCYFHSILHCFTIYYIKITILETYYLWFLHTVFCVLFKFRRNVNNYVEL